MAIDFIGYFPGYVCIPCIEGGKWFKEKIKLSMYDMLYMVCKRILELNRGNYLERNVCIRFSVLLPPPGTV